jgi:hypothetical protein
VRVEEEEAEEEGSGVCRLAPVCIGMERERPMGAERGGKNLKGEAGAVVYIWFTEFGREAGEAENKGEKPNKSRRSSYRRESI